MTPEEEKLFDEQFDKMLADAPEEVRGILEKKRADIKGVVDKVGRGIEETDAMLRRRLGPLYPFVVPTGKEVPFTIMRPPSV